MPKILNGSYAAKTLPRTPGHDLPTTLTPDPTPEGLLHFGTCRKGNLQNSTRTAIRLPAPISQQYLGLQPIATEIR
jgi:hypothetical protein